jgi:hypothetical protein
MSDHSTPPVDLDKMTAAELEQYIDMHATADAESAIAIMLDGIREQQTEARAALDQGENDPKQRAKARELVETAAAASDWLTTNAATFEHVHHTAFTRGAFWMLQQIPRGENT